MSQVRRKDLVHKIAEQRSLLDARTRASVAEEELRKLSSERQRLEEERRRLQEREERKRERKRSMRERRELEAERQRLLNERLGREQAEREAREREERARLEEDRRQVEEERRRLEEERLRRQRELDEEQNRSKEERERRQKEREEEEQRRKEELGKKEELLAQKERELKEKEEEIKRQREEELRERERQFEQQRKSMEQNNGNNSDGIGNSIGTAGFNNGHSNRKSGGIDRGTSDSANSTNRRLSRGTSGLSTTSSHYRRRFFETNGNNDDNERRRSVGTDAVFDQNLDNLNNDFDGKNGNDFNGNNGNDFNGNNGNDFNGNNGNDFNGTRGFNKKKNNRGLTKQFSERGQSAMSDNVSLPPTALSRGPLVSTGQSAGTMAKEANMWDNIRERERMLTQWEEELNAREQEESRRRLAFEKEMRDRRREMSAELRNARNSEEERRRNKVEKAIQAERLDLQNERQRLEKDAKVMDETFTSANLVLPKISRNNKNTKKKQSNSSMVSEAPKERRKPSIMPSIASPVSTAGFDSAYSSQRRLSTHSDYETLSEFSDSEYLRDNNPNVGKVAGPDLLGVKSKIKAKGSKHRKRKSNVKIFNDKAYMKAVKRMQNARKDAEQKRLRREARKAAKQAQAAPNKDVVPIIIEKDRKRAGKGLQKIEKKEKSNKNDDKKKNNNNALQPIDRRKRK